MKILVTGSTGLVGTALVSELLRDGHTVCRLLRRESALAGAPDKSVPMPWDPATGELGKEAAGADAVVNLAGASIVSGRWNEVNKRLFVSSRVEMTRKLVAAIGKLRPPPRALLSASAVGYYGSRGDEVLTEESAPGDDFPAFLAKGWEAAALEAEAAGIRVVRLRIGVVLSKKGGALARMLKPFRLGIGGRLGSGQQWMSWVTVQDVLGAIQFALRTAELKGAANVVAPQPARNTDFTRALAKTLHRPAIFPVPAFVLRLAAGEMADAILLASQRAIPKRLQDAGYRFRHPELAEALPAVLAGA